MAGFDGSRRGGASGPGKGTVVQRSATAAPGKRTRTQALPPRDHDEAVQRRAEVDATNRAAWEASDPRTTAADGVESAAASLPHHAQIQASFGKHDVSHVRAQVGGTAATAAQDLGASAFAIGDRVGFASNPDLHTAAHEAAHVVQQRGGVQLAGGIDGGANDPYEQHADRVADAVVAGNSAEALIDAAPRGAAAAVVQRRTEPAPPRPTGDVWQDLFKGSSQKVEKLARVSAPNGRHLFKEPRPDAAAASAVIPFNGLVQAVRESTQAKEVDRWCYVVASDGSAGFCERRYLAVDPPDPTAKLFRVSHGQTLGQIADLEYGSNITAGNDARLYVQALYEVNKDRAGIYLTEVNLPWYQTLPRGHDEIETVEIYKSVKVKEGFAIWIPSNQFIQALKSAGAVTSGATYFKEALRKAKEIVSDAVDFVEFVAGVVVGALEGAYEAVRDLIKGVADLLGMAFDFVKTFITSGAIGVIISAAKKIKKLITEAPEMVKKLGEYFAHRWNASGMYGKGELVGEIVGYIAVNVVLAMATGGASAEGEVAAGGTELAEASSKVMRTVDVVDEIKTVRVEVPPELETGLSKKKGGGPGAAHIHDESFSANRKYEGSVKHGARARNVGGRIVQKAPTNGQAALDMSFEFSKETPRRIGVDVATGEFVVFDRTGNLVAEKQVVGGVYHGHVRTWEQLDPEMRKVLIDHRLVDRRGRITFDPKQWDVVP
jgi:hypothetical protein